MSAPANAQIAALWGKIVLHNKLMVPEQWEECLAQFHKLNGQVAIDQVILDKGYLTERHLGAIRKKIQEVIDKQKPAGGTAPASAPPKPATKEAPKPEDAAASTPAEPVAVKPAGDDMPLAAEPAGDAKQPAANWRPSDAEWVETTDDAAKASASLAPGSPPIEQIEMVGEDEITADPAAAAKKLIREGEGSLLPRLGKKPSGSPPPAAAKRPAPAVAPPPGEVPDDPAARIACDVAPNDVDPGAMSLLTEGVQLGASDVHLASGSPPFFRLYGALRYTDRPPLTPDQTRRMVLGFMNDEQQQHYLRHHDLDFSFEHETLGRFRVNALEQFRGPDIIFRCIPNKVPTLEELGLPPTLAKFTEWHQGLVLVTGPAGAGKTTTAAALINLVNQGRKDHVITVEDPVEFLHVSAGCNITQRQVPIHTKSFASALKAALREDPDVIMIGEMRDLETVSLAIRAAETGHLVIGTLQTKSAARTIDRVIDVFPSDQQSQIRTMLSESLRGIISQQLIPRADGKGRVAAIEVLHVVSSVSNLIRDAKTFQLPSLMQTGKKLGQRTMDDSISELLNAGLITRDDAIKAAENPKNFRKEEPAGEIKLKK